MLEGVQILLCDNVKTLAPYRILASFILHHLLCGHEAAFLCESLTPEFLLFWALVLFLEKRLFWFVWHPQFLSC